MATKAVFHMLLPNYLLKNTSGKRFTFLSTCVGRVLVGKHEYKVFFKVLFLIDQSCCIFISPWTNKRK